MHSVNGVLWVLVSDLLTHAIPAPSEMLDRHPAQRRFSAHLHADGILTGISRGIACTNAADGANTTIATPDKGTGERLCFLQGHRASWICYVSIMCEVSERGDPGGGVHKPCAQALQKAPQRYDMIMRATCASRPHQCNLLIAPTEALYPDATLQRWEAEEFTNDNQLPGTGACLMEEAETPGRPSVFPVHDWTLASTRLGGSHHAPLLCLVWQLLPKQARRSDRLLFVLAYPLQHIPLLLQQLRHARIVLYPVSHRHPSPVCS